MDGNVLIQLCECGCGKETAIGKKFRKGHTSISQGTPYFIERDMGYDTPCHYWMRAVDGDGYPKANRGRMHRVYFEDAYGPLHKGMVIDHLCKVHRCVNVKHLEAVTVTENRRRGIQVVLSERDIPVIRLMLDHGISKKDIGEALGVSCGSIKQVANGKSWNDC